MSMRRFLWGYLVVQCATVLTVFPAGAAELNALLGGRGIWVQAPESFSSGRLEELKLLGVRRLHVMVAFAPSRYKSCDNPPTQKLRAKLFALTNFVKGAKRDGFLVIITAYMPPNRAAVEAFTAASDIGPLLSFINAGADGVEYDLEGGWSTSAVCGYGSHADASRILLERSRALKSNFPAGVTTHIGRAHDVNLGLERADWVSLQVYSKCPQSGCLPFEDQREGPGHRQSRAPQALASFTGPVVMGLANFWQQWKGHTPEEAMGRALDATKIVQEKHPNFVGHTYWSTSWLDSEGVRTFMAATAK